MSVNYVKLLELVAIEKKNEKSYLRIKLTCEQEFEFFWRIDSETAKKFENIFEFDGNHKYRLSLHTLLDTSKNQFIGSLTKTYRNISDRIYFTCSVDYKNCLESIKNSQSITDLNNLPFISMNLPALDETKIPKKIKKNELVISKRYISIFKWLSIISVILVIIFVTSNHDVYKTKIDGTVAIASHSEISIIPVNLTLEKKNITSATKLESDDSSQSSFPYIEIDDSITYSIAEGYVALTFDDGPSKYTMAITDILKQYKVGGTFFFLGTNAKKYPDSVRYVQLNGHSIGSHSMNHSVMTKLSIEKQEDELLQSAQAIEEITKEEVVLFRPPYGDLNEQVKEVIYNNEFKVILWNKDSEDWKTHDSDKIFNYVRDTEVSGSVIIFHESQSVIDALPKIIENLQERNLKIVNLH
ncbi:polysaccharide deacetylase family protein [Paenibacillus endoradicis]|uniref:polysaccharide deacetylase family protein n=1 Tax=Paenibacillus endoradicis TaxID=2972487 RepID=UPI002159912F|nr:polysaccharide deacetylase family protein [Paenibacillus endoradicis]MCR8658797.1 polysaccharide deacetylase family protein [Paenibacillus endoradicis]